VIGNKKLQTAAIGRLPALGHSRVASNGHAWLAFNQTSYYWPHARIEKHSRISYLISFVSSFIISNHSMYVNLEISKFGKRFYGAARCRQPGRPETD
jgi:hypothetical protein